MPGVVPVLAGSDSCLMQECIIIKVSGAIIRSIKPAINKKISLLIKYRAIELMTDSTERMICSIAALL